MKYFKSFIWAALFVSISIISNAKTENFFINQEIAKDRGLEIRYIKMELNDQKELPKEIKVEGVIYPLYETKEDAYNATINSGIKKDITIVYVISATEREKEMLSLPK